MKRIFFFFIIVFSALTCAYAQDEGSGGEEASSTETEEAEGDTTATKPLPEPPKVGFARVAAQLAENKVDTSNLRSMTIAQLEAKLKALQEMRNLASLHVQYAMAYEIPAAELKKRQEVAFGFVRSMALAKNRLDYLKLERGRKVVKKLQALEGDSFFKIVNDSTGEAEFLDKAFVDEIKANIFDSGQRPNIQTNSINKFITKPEEYDIKPHQPARGYRIGLDGYHQLIILKLKDDSVVAIIWKKTKLKMGESPVKAVY